MEKRSYCASLSLHPGDKLSEENVDPIEAHVPGPGTKVRSHLQSSKGARLY